MLTTKKAGPEGWPWVVVQEDGGMVAACPDETTAERVAFLLGTWKGGASAPRVLVEAGRRVPYGSERPARVEPAPSGAARGVPAAPAAPVPGGFPDDPRPGRVYDVLTGEDVTDRYHGRASPPVRSPLEVRGVEPIPPEAWPAPRATAPEDDGAERRASWAPPPSREALPGSGGWQAGEARIYPRAGGGFAVSFPRRPALHVRAELKAGGFRWDPLAGEWRGSRLPARFLPVRS